MNITIIKDEKEAKPLYEFLNSISADLLLKIDAKFQAYKQFGDVYYAKQLKSLNSKIWKYKGTIYKLRVDHAQESARVLFAKVSSGDLVIIHGFIKSTQKTPKKEARQAIAIYQKLSTLETKQFDPKCFIQ